MTKQNIHESALNYFIELQEPFDYTKWQENLFEDMTIEEIYNNAADLRNKTRTRNAT
jgi:hypothetical protein